MGVGKVVTSQGLVEFVQEGKFTNVPDHKAEKPKEAPVLEVKPDEKPAELGEKPANGADGADGAVVTETKPPEAPETDEDAEGLTKADKDLAERVRKRINAKHRAMKEAQEARDEAERFAETQYNERKLAEQRALALEQRAKELEAKIVPPPEAPKEPLETDPKYQVNGQFDWKSYTRDVAEFVGDQKVQAERKRMAEEAAAREQAEKERIVKERIDKVRSKHNDFDALLERVKGTEADQVPLFVQNYLEESENGGEILYYLLKNPEAKAKISALKPILGIAELGKLESEITKPAAPIGQAVPVIKAQGGGAPAPITPLSGEGSVGINTDPSKMSYKELRAYERERARRH